MEPFSAVAAAIALTGQVSHSVVKIIEVIDTYKSAPEELGRLSSKAMLLVQSAEILQSTLSEHSALFAHTSPFWIQNVEITLKTSIEAFQRIRETLVGLQASSRGRLRSVISHKNNLAKLECQIAKEVETLTHLFAVTNSCLAVILVQRATPLQTLAELECTPPTGQALVQSAEPETNEIQEEGNSPEDGESVIDGTRINNTIGIRRRVTSRWSWSSPSLGIYLHQEESIITSRRSELPSLGPSTTQSTLVLQLTALRRRFRLQLQDHWLASPTFALRVSHVIDGALGDSVGVTLRRGTLAEFIDYFKDGKLSLWSVGTPQTGLPDIPTNLLHLAIHAERADVAQFLIDQDTQGRLLDECPRAIHATWKSTHSTAASTVLLRNLQGQLSLEQFAFMVALDSKASSIFPIYKHISNLPAAEKVDYAKEALFKLSVVASHYDTYSDWVGFVQLFLRLLKDAGLGATKEMIASENALLFWKYLMGDFREPSNLHLYLGQIQFKLECWLKALELSDVDISGVACSIESLRPKQPEDRAGPWKVGSFSYNGVRILCWVHDPDSPAYLVLEEFAFINDYTSLHCPDCRERSLERNWPYTNCGGRWCRHCRPGLFNELAMSRFERRQAKKRGKTSKKTRYITGVKMPGAWVD